MNCTNCPDNCLSQETDLRCVYDGRTGESLTSILDSLAGQSSSAKTDDVVITSDDIVSKSLMRSKSYVCSAKIVKRDFTYGLSISQNTTLFTWDFLGVLQVLPAGYKTAKIEVKATGQSTGTNALINSKTASGGTSINASSFPVSVDILVRLTSPCGDIDLTSSLTLNNPIAVGTYGTKFDAKDLNPQTGTISLTNQLDSLESQVSSNILKTTTVEELLKELQLEIADLKSQISELQS